MVNLFKYFKNKSLDHLDHLEQIDQAPVFLPAVTTFFTMVYLLIVIPHILEHAGLPLSDSFFSVCLLAGLASIFSGWFSKTPIAFAPGLGLLSFFAYVVVGQQHIPWQIALACVFCANILLILISITPIRRWILESIPPSLGGAIAAGIGFFLGMLALHNAGVIEPSHETLVKLGTIHALPTLLFIIGFFVIVILDARQIPGAILIGVLLVSILDWLFGNAVFKGFLAAPNIHPTTWGQLDFSALGSMHMLMTIFTFFLIGLFDSTGCILGLLKSIPKCNQFEKKVSRSLLVESCSSTVGALMGLTTCSPLLESGTGIRAGGRTGGVSIWVGIFLLLSIFLSPFAQSIPNVAVSSALFYVACLMMRPIAQVAWSEFTEMVPAIVTVFTIPLTFSISDGVGMGVLTYLALNLSYGHWRKVKPGLYLIAAFFLIYFLSI